MPLCGAVARRGAYWLSRMTWRDILILAAISALLSAAITACIKAVFVNLTF
jgi:hypothetical protein